MKTVRWHLMHQNKHAWTVIHKGRNLFIAPLLDSDDPLLDETVGAIDTYSKAYWGYYHKKAHVCPEYIVRDGKKIKVECITVFTIESGWGEDE